MDTEKLSLVHSHQTIDYREVLDKVKAIFELGLYPEVKIIGTKSIATIEHDFVLYEVNIYKERSRVKSLLQSNMTLD